MTEHETTKIVLSVRKCNDCEAEAVPLEGEGVDCHECDTGEFGEPIRGKTLTVDPRDAKTLREEHPEAVFA